MELASPGLPSFDYIRAASPAEVSDLLLQHPEEARLFMGGTDIFVQMRGGALTPKMLVDLKHLPGLTEITFDANTGLRIGAAANMNAIARHPAVIEHYPLLAETIKTVAAYPLRTRATMGGNLCNASPGADTAPAALVLEAALIAAGPEGERAIAAAAFFSGPGKTALEPGEFLARIDIPLPPGGWAGRFAKLGRNAQGDLAIASAAAVGYPDDSAPSGYRFRVALGSVAPTPIRVPEAEAILAKRPINDETLEAASLAAREASAPIDDLRASAAYRKAMVQTLTRRALADAYAGCGS